MAVATYVGSFAKQTATGNQDITIPVDLTAAAAGSWAIIFSTTGSTSASGTWGAMGYTSLGFTTAAANSYATGVWSTDAVATSVTARRMAAKCLTAPTTSGASVQWEADFVSFPSSTTMRLNWTTNAGGAEVIAYKIITGLTNAKVVNWTTPASVGTKSVTGVGFKPDLVLHADAVLTGTLPQSTTNSIMGFGAMNKHGQQWANSVVLSTASNPSNTSRWQQTDACMASVGATEGQQWQAHFQSMDSDGFTTYFSTDVASGYNVISLCLGGVSSKLGSFTNNGGTAPLSQTIPSRHGFAVRGALLSMTAGAGGPSTQAFWSMGVTDGTNSRAVALQDLDAVTPTSAKAVWFNNKVIAMSDAATSPSTYISANWSSSTTSDFTISLNPSPSDAREILYLLLGDAGTNTFPSMMPTASSITNAAATGYSNQKHAVTLSTGRMVMVASDTGTNAKFVYSDDGITGNEVDYGVPIGGWSNGSIAAYVDSGGTERLVAVWKQSGTSGTGGTGGARTDLEPYCMVGTFNAGRATLTWGAAVIVGGVGAGTWTAIAANYLDVACVAEGTGGVAHVAISGTGGGTTDYVYTAQQTISNAGVITAGTNASQYAVATSAIHTFPSIDIDSSTKRVHLAYSAGTTGAGKGIRYRTASYSAGAWTWATEVEVDNTRYVFDNTYFVNCRWDAGRSKVIVGGCISNGTTTDSLRAFESSSFTSFGAAILDSNVTTARLTPGSMTIDAATGDLYFVGSTPQLSSAIGYYKWVRATTTLNALVQTDANTGNTTGYPYAWFSGSTIRWIYTRGNNAPYALTYNQITLNTTPTIAYGASSLADASFPNTATPTLTVYVTDPDSSQTLTVTYEVATDSGFVTIVYTGTNTAASPQTAGAVSKTTSALSKATLLYWRARVSDGTATSANTTTRTFTIYDDPTVAIGASTPATTTSTGGPTLNVGWTYGQGQSLAEAFYRVQVQTNGGATTYYDTGTLAGPATSVALDAVALSIPTDTTGTALQVVVTVTAATTGTVVSATKTFDIQWGVVTVGIVSPSNGAIVATTGITAQWTFASTRSKLQGSYRIRLMIASTGSVLLDTGFVTSAATSAAVGVILVDGSTYSLEVTLKNDQGILGT